MNYERAAILYDMNTKWKSQIGAAALAAAALALPACSSHTVDGRAAVSEPAPTSASAYEHSVTPTTTAKPKPQMIHLNASTLAGMNDKDAVEDAARAAKSFYLSLGLEMPKVWVQPIDGMILQCPAESSKDDAVTCDTDPPNVYWSTPYVAKMRAAGGTASRAYSVMALMGHEYGHVAARYNGGDFSSEASANCLAGAFLRAQGAGPADAGQGFLAEKRSVQGGDYAAELEDFAQGASQRTPQAAWELCKAK